MSNPYVFNSYQYSPSHQNGLLNNTSPTFSNLLYVQGASSSAGSDTSLTSSLGSLLTSNYSFHNPRLRYYLSKLFDIEDDLEFCPEIPEHSHIKKFNPYTASVFSPTSQDVTLSPGADTPTSPRVHTPRIKKPLEIINPQTKMRVTSAHK